MTVTKTKVTFGLYDLTINPYSTPSFSEPLQGFSDITDFQKGDDARVDKNPTYEPDFWLLDGSFQMNTSHVGIMSQQQSNSNGDFLVYPSLTLDFDTVQSAKGLVLRFSPFTGDWCSNFNISFYDAALLEIANDNYYITDASFSTDLSVENFKKIVITFYATNKPFRYLRLSSIDYGELILFGHDKIKTCNILEQIDRSGLTLPSNTFTLQIYDAEGFYSPLNPDGVSSDLQKNQPFDVYQTIDAVEFYMGRFYLDKWKNTTEGIMKFDCVDALSLLSGIPYLGNVWGYISVLGVANQIASLTNLQFNVDGISQTRALIGQLPNSNCRSILQWVAFSCRVIIDCSRSSGVEIKDAILSKNIITPNQIISSSNVALSRPIEEKSIVSGVDVTAYTFAYDGLGYVQLLSEVLPDGDYLRKFDSTYFNFYATGAIILEYGSSWVKFRVTSDYFSYSGVSRAGQEGLFQKRFRATGGTRTVVVNARKLVSSEKIVSVRNPVTPKIEKIIQVEGIKSIGGNGVYAIFPEAVAQHLYDFGQENFMQSSKILALNIGTGFSVSFETYRGRTMKGIIDKANINLSGGFVVDAEITGLIE